MSATNEGQEEQQSVVKDLKARLQEETKALQNIQADMKFESTELKKLTNIGKTIRTVLGDPAKTKSNFGKTKSAIIGSIADLLSPFGEGKLSDKFKTDASGMRRCFKGVYDEDLVEPR